MTTARKRKNVLDVVVVASVAPHSRAIGTMMPKKNDDDDVAAMRIVPNGMTKSPVAVAAVAGKLLLNSKTSQRGNRRLPACHCVHRDLTMPTAEGLVVAARAAVAPNGHRFLISSTVGRTQAPAVRTGAVFDQSSLYSSKWQR